MPKRKKTKIDFLFEPDVQQRSFFIKKMHLSMQKLSRLFPVPPPSITVHIFQNRTVFLNAIHKKKAPKWLIAYVPPKSTSDIFIISSKNKQTEKKKISQVLLHEMTHLYTNMLNPNLPDWVKEGVSVYVAEQIFSPSTSTADWKKIARKDVPFQGIPWKLAVKYNGYNVAGLLILFLVRQYGWKKFINLISPTPFRPRYPSRDIPFYFREEFKCLILDFKKQFVK